MIVFLKQIAIEGPGTMGDFFKNAGFKTRIIDLEAGESLPASLEDIESVVVLGGPMNVYEEQKHPFLADENLFIQKVIEAEIPFMGICLGSQLLAKACDAKVTKAPEKEVGFYDVALTEEGTCDPLFKGLEPNLKVFQWHEDAFNIPKQARHLAQSERCHHQAFRVGKNAYGLQFHVEVKRDIIESWIKEYWKIEDAEQDQKAQDILGDYDKMKTKFNTAADILYNNFLDIVKESQ
ncbi:MAG: type 1 glutamine amidotransferase [Candidatus Aceula meridiana]|nr:type 1 glutamine amidotransferase [Candidatus Aceula meridiana]